MTDTKIFNKNVASYLFEYRKNHSFSRSEIDSKMGKGAGWYREIERGRNGLSFSDAIKLCNILGIDLNELGDIGNDRNR